MCQKLCVVFRSRIKLTCSAVRHAFDMSVPGAQEYFIQLVKLFSNSYEKKSKESKLLLCEEGTKKRYGNTSCDVASLASKVVRNFLQVLIKMIIRKLVSFFASEIKKGDV